MTDAGIGARLIRKEDDRYMRGRGQFVGDIKLAGMQEVAQIHVDAARNLYVTEVSNDRSQMFRPKSNADPNRIVGPMAMVNPKPSRGAP